MRIKQPCCIKTEMKLCFSALLSVSLSTLMHSFIQNSNNFNRLLTLQTPRQPHYVPPSTTSQFSVLDNLTHLRNWGVPQEKNRRKPDLHDLLQMCTDLNIWILQSSPWKQNHKQRHSLSFSLLWTIKKSQKWLQFIVSYYYYLRE